MDLVWEGQASSKQIKTVPESEKKKKELF